MLVAGLTLVGIGFIGASTIAFGLVVVIEVEVNTSVLFKVKKAIPRVLLITVVGLGVAKPVEGWTFPHKQ